MTKSYDVVIEVGEEVAAIARSVSEFLATQKEVCFTLDTTKHVPHVTLYHVSLEETQLPSVLAALSEVASALSFFPIHQTEYQLGDGRWVSMRYEREEFIQKLHNLVLEVVGKLRVKEEGTQQTEEWSDRSPERQENLELYGASEIRSLYIPHLTLTRLVEKSDMDILDSLPGLDFSFTASAIALYELGEYGTCHSLLGIFPLTDGTL